MDDCYTVNRVALTKKQPPFNGAFSWYVLTCFRRSDERRMARVESREKITSGRESKMKAVCQLHNAVHIFTVRVVDLLSSLTAANHAFRLHIAPTSFFFFGHLRITVA